MVCFRNTEGTLNYQNRIQKFSISLTPTDATASHPSSPNLHLQYLETVLFTDPKGQPTTGLDADATGSISFPGFPQMPVATFTGDGWNGTGPGGKRITVDAEGLVLNSDGSFWVSDEYGDFVWKFSPEGKMIQAIQPPQAFLPRRNGTVSFSSDSAPITDPDRTVTPSDPDSGRENNHGFEGLTASPDGKTLYALAQAALDQDGGEKKKDERYARLVVYDVSGEAAVYTHEYVVPLPLYGSDDDTAAQSEIHYINENTFLVLARDSGAGHGQSSSESIYRHADIFNIANATDVKSSTTDAATGSIASSKGKLNSGITPATYCSFLDFNVNSELARFGLHNGGDQNASLLNEKWESLVLAPVDGENGEDGEFFLFSLSDDDFITQDGKYTP